MTIRTFEFSFEYNIAFTLFAHKKFNAADRNKILTCLLDKKLSEAATIFLLFLPVRDQIFPRIFNLKLNSSPPSLSCKSLALIRPREYNCFMIYSTTLWEDGGSGSFRSAKRRDVPNTISRANRGQYLREEVKPASTRARDLTCGAMTRDRCPSALAVKGSRLSSRPHASPRVLVHLLTAEAP